MLNNKKYAKSYLPFQIIVSFIGCFLFLLKPGMCSADIVNEPICQYGYGLLHCTAISPDETKIVTGSADGKVRIWNMKTGTIDTTFTTHLEGIISVNFSPNGKNIITGSQDNTAKLWDASTGGLIRIFKGHTGSVSSAAFSPDGSKILTASYDSTAKLWDASTGNLIYTFGTQRDIISSVDFSPDGQKILTGSLDYSVIEWDVSTGKQIRSFLTDTFFVYALKYSPDGARIAIGTSYGKVYLWDSVPGDSHFLSKENDHITSISFSSDGKKLLLGRARTIELWDLEVKSLIKYFENQAFYVKLISADTNVLIGSYDQTVKIWNPYEENVIRTFTGYTKSLYMAVFSPDEANVLTSSLYDDTIRTWDAIKANMIDKFCSGLFSPIAFMPSGLQLLTRSLREVILWDIKSGDSIRVFKGHSDIIGAIAVFNDGSKVLSGSADGTAILWDIKTGIPLKVFSGTQTSIDSDGEVLSVDATSDGSHIATASDCSAKLWNVSSGKVVRTFTGHTKIVLSVCFSPDGKRIITGSTDETARLWDVATGDLIRVFVDDYEIRSVKFSPDGKYVLTGAKHTTIWNAATGEKIRILGGGGSPVFSASFSKDGTRVLTSSGDGTAELWDISDIAASAKETAFRKSSQLTFTNTGKFLKVVNPDAAGSSGALLNIYTLSGRKVKSFQLQNEMEFILTVNFKKGNYCYQYINGIETIMGVFTIAR